MDLEGRGTESALSLRAASKIALDRRRRALAALPPNIDDITAVLKTQKPNAKIIAKRKREADRKPPNTKSKAKLAAFYLDRGLAAGLIGRFDQEMSDLMTSVRLTRQIGSDPRPLWEAANALLGSGRFFESTQLREEAIRRSKDSRKRIFYHAVHSWIYALLDRTEKAEESLSAAEKILRSGVPQAFWRKRGKAILSRMKSSKARIFFSQGKFIEAEHLMREAISLADGQLQRNEGFKYDNSEIVRARSRAVLAIWLAKQGRVVDAEIESRRALGDWLKSSSLFSTHTPLLLNSFASVLTAQGRYNEAAQLVDFSIAVMKTLGHDERSARLLKALLHKARIAFHSGRSSDAIAIYDEVDRQYKSNKALYELFAEQDLDRLLALAYHGRHHQILNNDHSLSDNAHRNFGREFIVGARAIARAKSGDLVGAHEDFRRAVERLSTYQQHSANEEYTLTTGRRIRNRILFDAYLELLEKTRGTGLEDQLKINATEEGLRIADRARDQLVQRALTAAAARASIANKELARLVRVEQDTRKRLTAVGGEMTGLYASVGGDANAKELALLQRDQRDLKRALATISKTITKRFPDYASLLNPKVPSVGEIKSALKPGEVYVSIYVARDRTYVWALPKHGPIAYHSSGLSRASVQRITAKLRSALDPQVDTLGDIPPFDTKLAYRLYAELLHPIRETWQNADTLLISTNGALSQLPFGVLPTEPSSIDQQAGPLFAAYRDVKWLQRSHAVSLMPSATSLVTLRRLSKRKTRRDSFIGVGNPVFSVDQLPDVRAGNDPDSPKVVANTITTRGSAISLRSIPVRLRSSPDVQAKRSLDLSPLPALPDTADELRSIATSLKVDPARSVVLGLRANEEHIRKLDLTKYRYVAFATHGLVPGEMGLRQPALALSDPKLSKSDGDGLLTMSEIMTLKMDADWVILSACNTGSARGQGSDAISGLGRAFFYAGSKALLVSSWPVESTSARLLTTDIFARLAVDENLSRAQALRMASSALIDRPAMLDPNTNTPIFFYAHPLFWAPFILVGDGAA